MNNLWITSDTHFGHNRGFLYEPRGFNSIEEHDEVIISNWNEIVSPKDVVIHLGDAILNDFEHGMKCLKRLNGTLCFIRGNHDTDKRWNAYAQLGNVILSSGWSIMLKNGKWRFYLSHYPTLIGNFNETNPKFWNLCGHSHTKDKWQDITKGQIYHVELDAHNNYPVNIEEIKEDIRNYKATH